MTFDQTRRLAPNDGAKRRAAVTSSPSVAKPATNAASRIRTATRGGVD